MKSMFSAKCVILSSVLLMLIPFISRADVSDGTTQNKLDPAETGYDFISNGIYYKILGGDSVSTSEGDVPYVGKIVIPDEVVYNNVTYKVTKVSGFINSPDVTEITIPKYTEIISGFYGADSEWGGGPGIKSVELKSETAESTQVSKLTKVYFNAENCKTAYYSYSQSTMLGGGYYGYQKVFPATVTIVEFGEGVTRIPNGLLMDCTEITELTFPKSVKYIGWKIIEPGKDKVSNCQLLCEDLQEIGWLPDNELCVKLGTDFHTYPCGVEYGIYQDIPSGMNYDISKYSTMFHDFIGLNFADDEPIELPLWVENIAPNAFEGCKTGFKLALPETIKTINASAFENCEQLEEITIPASVKSIGIKAFNGCTNLKTLYYNAENCADVESPYPFASCTSLNNVVIGDGVTRIPGKLFMNCAGLKQIEISESVVEIGKYAFCSTGLEEVSIPKSVVTIGEYAFFNCEDLTTLYYNTTNCMSVNNLFEGCVSLANVYFGENVTKIPDYLLARCTGLKHIEIPNNIIEIGECAFTGTGLTTVEIPNSITTIGMAAFNDCLDLATVRFNAPNCNAGQNIFEGCETLSCVEFGDGVTKVPSYLLEFNSGLKEIKISESVTEIGEYAFWSSGLEEVTIPERVASIGESAFAGCKGLKTVNFDAENCDVKNPFRGSAIENLVFGERVSKISSSFAYECNSLTKVTIPENVTEIGGLAFSYCQNLTALQFNAVDCKIVPNDNEQYNPFWDSPLTEVSFGENVTAIPNHLLAECKKVTQIKIPDSVKKIGDYAFYWAGLTDVTIPNSVTHIGKGAFQECWRLASLTIGSSVEEIGDMAFYAYGENVIKNVASLNPIPPKMPKDAFFVNIYWNATLSVPTGALTAYQEAESWKEFRKLTEVDFVGIEDVEATDESPSTYYNLQGVEVENPQNGMFIKRQGKKISKVVIY